MSVATLRAVLTDILRALTDAAAHTPWLKIIITSRPEVDIQCSFDALVQSSYLQHDLTDDPETTSDLRIFAWAQFKRVALNRRLGFPWPEQSLFDDVISVAAGLFIFIDEITLLLEQCEDPNESLKATLRASVGTGSTTLYGLYSSILMARVVHSKAELR